MDPYIKHPLLNEIGSIIGDLLIVAGFLLPIAAYLYSLSN